MHMSEQNQSQPFKTLGLRLKRLREDLNQSVAEVSGAVEIETDTLQQFEQGAKRPTEDILMLLMSYFGMSEDESTKLWELAGYTNYHSHMHDHDHDAHSPVDDAADGKPTLMMVMQADNRIMYTDMVQVTANNFGIVLNFLQSGGSRPATPIARLGMSREHAQSVLELLHSTLQQMDQQPKILPEPKDDTPTN